MSERKTLSLGVPLAEVEHEWQSPFSLVIILRPYDCIFALASITRMDGKVVYGVEFLDP
jgi:hypothetical protein